MPSLDEMRSKKNEPTPRPRATVTVTLVEGQHLLDEIGRLADEAKAVMRKAMRVTGEDGEPKGPPRKAAESSTPPRVAEIRVRVGELEDQLPDHQADLGLVGFDGGAWQRFKNDHPPRVIGHQETRREDGAVVQGPPIYDPADEEYALGFCDADALYDALGQFVAEWEGEPVGPGEWDDWLGERITYADRRDLITSIVEMHEARVRRVPKSPSGSSETETGSTD